MSFNTTYGLLFEVTLLHNYFLNNGKDAYTGMSTDDQKKMLQKFNADSFATITPTLETYTAIKNYKMVFKNTQMGFRVYIKSKEGIETEPFIKTPLDLKLNFIITINDYQFENYTDIKFAVNQIFLFSNVKPLSEPVTFKYIPDINDNILISKDFLISEETTIDIISKLQPSEKQDVFGLVSLTMKGDNNLGNIVVSDKMVSPNFKIHFDNRKTIWKYINRKAGTEIKTKDPKPLTYSGFVEIDPTKDFDTLQNDANQYPNPSAKSITKINGDYCSEIFI